MLRLIGSIVSLILIICFIIDRAPMKQTTSTIEAKPQQVIKPIPSKKIVVAVIDTGIADELMQENFLCPDGHKDFTGTSLTDRHSHGSHISGIIDQYAKNKVFTNFPNREIHTTVINYCQIIYKYYDPKATNNDNLINTKKALNAAIEAGVDIINYSGGGVEPDSEEKAIIIKALNKGIIIVAAAGNEKSDIDKHPYYPAMHDKRIIVVGNLDHSGNIVSSSNYGESVKYWEPGLNVLSYVSGGYVGYMTGTSQAAAIKTGKIIRELLSTK